MMIKAWLLLMLLGACHAFKILVVFPLPSRSHGILGDGVVRLLLNAGHEVTYITPFPLKTSNANIRNVQVSDVFQAAKDMNLRDIMDKKVSVGDPRQFFNVLADLAQSTVMNETVQKLINDPKETFDLVVAEWMFTEMYCGFAAIFNCPYVWVSSTEPSSMVLSLIDDHINPSYNSGLFSTKAPPFNFFERAKELAIHVGVTLLKEMVFQRRESLLYEELYGPVIRRRGGQVPPFEEVKYNASLMLGNSHISIGQPIRLPQNYKSVRGYHIDPDIKPLPENLRKILDGAKNGLIYFSMGSNLNSKDIDENLKRGLLKTFGELKQTVLWKFEDDIENLPKNVHIVRWAPQTSILAHPNCILFISHGGGLSTTETVYFGKPTIGIPVFGDQFTNVDMAVQKGFSIKVDLDYNLPENLRVALKEMLSNPRYTEKAKEASFIYHHRPMTPGAEVVLWIEHVIRTGGAPHLRSLALLVPFYQKYYLDLAATLIATACLLYLMVKSLWNCMCKKKSVNNKKKKQ